MKQIRVRKSTDVKKLRPPCLQCGCRLYFEQTMNVKFDYENKNKAHRDEPDIIRNILTGYECSKCGHVHPIAKWRVWEMVCQIEDERRAATW